LWRLQEANVKAVQELVGVSRPLAYTTIMTVLDRMVRKGKLTRRKTGRSFVYAPSQTRDAMRRLAVQELVDGYFDGSEAELMDFLRNSQAAAHAPASMEAEGRIDAALL
jgi:predicted transcriptional regulator